MLYVVKYGSCNNLNLVFFPRKIPEYFMKIIWPKEAFMRKNVIQTVCNML